jgi:hypothetical protein
MRARSSGERDHCVVDVRGGGHGVLEGRRPGRTGEGGGATATSGGRAAPGGGSGVDLLLLGYGSNPTRPNQTVFKKNPNQTSPLTPWPIFHRTN